MNDAKVEFGDREIDLGCRPAQVVRPNELPVLKDPQGALLAAMRQPVGSPPLGELAAGARRLALILSDATRIFGQRRAAEAVVEELGALDGRDLTVAIAYGNHAAVDEETLELPPNLPPGTRIWHHRHRAYDEMTTLGSVPKENRWWYVRAACRDTPSYLAGALPCWWQGLVTLALGGPVASAWRLGLGMGIPGLFVKMLIAGRDTPVTVARPVAEADLIVTLGQVKPHFFMGYGGGIKSVVPGVASRKAIGRNHLTMRHPSARLGVVEGNVCRQNVERMVAYLPRIFAVNVVANGRGEMVAATAGDVVSSQRQAVEEARKMCRVPARRTEIVVAGAGYPEALEMYQMVKVIAPAGAIVKKGGAIVIAGPCPLGLGRRFLVNEVMYELNLRHILPRGVKVIAYTEVPRRLMLASRFVPAGTLQEAMALARKHAGAKGEVTLLRDAGMLDPIVE
ncbi:MAG: lactate racemase domain-containing protein [Planctomycetota bacterium]